ncbi:CoA ester lyase [Microbacterium sp.]|uniref:HpcH/HpaI aldolase/citrate lyase family protein n=1 Tax=Microbacterium sp. TaxID=51671 RepID=UPI0028125FDE|nr:CoA ester lyase [Microbacterium sp.]
MTDRIVLTALYVPADRPDRVSKALTAGADEVIVDLEDAVAPARKRDARAALVDALSAASSVQVRINARGSAWHDDDLAAIRELPATVAVRVPKIASADDVAAAREVVPGRRIHALIESAIGVERAFDIASAGVATLALGEADLRSQLGLPSGDDAGLQWIRSRVVNAAAAAGLPAPMMSAYTDVRDADGLAASCAAGRAMGFLGRTAIHPAQLPVIERAFRPSDAEVDRAREIVERVGSAADDGSGTVVLGDGTFLDVAMVEAARRVLAIATRFA